MVGGGENMVKMMLKFNSKEVSLLESVQTLNDVHAYLCAIEDAKNYLVIKKLAVV